MNDSKIVGLRIKERREQLGFTLEELGNSLNLNKSTIMRYENGEVQKIKLPILQALAQKLDVNPNWLALKTADMGHFEKTDYDYRYESPAIANDIVTYPVIGEIAAGYDQIAIEDWSGDTIEVPRSYLKGRQYSDFVCLQVKGDSMYPLYHDGDKVLVLKQNAVNESGDIAAVIYGNEYGTLKKVEISADRNTLKLIPINPQYVPVTITGTEIEHCCIIGIPKLIIREV